jgi:hypothetical protein
LDEAYDKPIKKAKKEKASDKVNVGPGLPTIQEEVQEQDTDTILNKRTRSGKAAASSQTAPDQPSIPKKIRKQARKLKLAAYVEEEEEQIAAATELVKRKKVADDATLQKVLELAKEIEVPASSLAREDAVTDAREIIKATEEVQELVTSEVGGLLMVAAEGVQEDNADASEASVPEASKR